MLRETFFREPLYTIQFDALQLRPRALLGLVGNGLSRWLAENLTPFPSLLLEYRKAVVVRIAHLSYTSPCVQFGLCPWLDVSVRLRTTGSGEWLTLDLDYEIDGTRAAEARMLLRVLDVEEPGSLVARPGSLPASLRELFHDAEVLAPEEFRDRARVRRPSGTGPELVPPRTWETVLTRSQCEVAEQWSFVEMAELATSARERIFSATDVPAEVRRQAVQDPIQNLVALFHRPMFVFDPCVVATRAHTTTDEKHVVFAHTVGHRETGKRPCMEVWELLG